MACDTQRALIAAPRHAQWRARVGHRAGTCSATPAAAEAAGAARFVATAVTAISVCVRVSWRFMRNRARALRTRRAFGGEFAARRVCEWGTVAATAAAAVAAARPWRHCNGAPTVCGVCGANAFTLRIVTFTHSNQLPSHFHTSHHIMRAI